MATTKKNGMVWGEVIAQIPISDNTELHVKLAKTQKGEEFIDIRKYVTTTRYTGYTPKGVLFPKSVKAEVIAALKKA